MNSNCGVEDEDEELFYFETDHLALKGNKDYSEVLKTIFILDSQRTKAIKDYDRVVELHKEALKNPLAFVQQLKEKKDLGIPELQIIADVPNIQWSKFKTNLPEEGLKFINEKHGNLPDRVNLSGEEKKLREQGDTHNKPWTTEEQRRLEELLVIYPPEAIELRRFKKIAAALGNRTVKQVTSRVQKYFLKLYKAGLPIPGRMPKYAERTKKSKLHSHQRFNHYLFKPTTFFPQLDIPVTMNESEPIPGPSTTNSSNPVLSNYLIPESTDRLELEKTHPEEPVDEINVQLSILRRVKHEKQKQDDFQSRFQHVGFKCDYCQDEPITGVRWHCRVCKDESVDFCSDCVVTQMYSGKPHPLSHKLEVIKDDANENSGLSDNLSNDSESAFESSLKNFDSSSTSDSENDNAKEEEMDLDYELHEEVKTNILCNNTTIKNNGEINKECDSLQLGDGQSVLPEEMDTLCEVDRANNFLGFDKFDLNSDTQDLSYNYLHSNLLLDGT